jgi:hypothetical protein
LRIVAYRQVDQNSCNTRDALLLYHTISEIICLQRLVLSYYEVCSDCISYWNLLMTFAFILSFLYSNTVLNILMHFEWINYLYWKDHQFYSAKNHFSIDCYKLYHYYIFSGLEQKILSLHPYFKTTLLRLV